MKRRKKLWIACAALAVVVALCTFALLYRPAPPYRFLDGAVLDRFEVRTVPPYAVPAGPRLLPKRVTFSAYKVTGTVESVTKAAAKELPAMDGWVWVSSNLAEHPGQRGWITFVTANDATGDEAAHVWVKIQRDTTFLDQLFVWSHKK